MYKIVNINDKLIETQLIDDYYVCLATDFGYGFVSSFYNPKNPSFNSISFSLPFLFIDGIISLEFLLRDSPEKEDLINLFKEFTNKSLGIKLKINNKDYIITIPQSRELKTLISKTMTPLICYFPIHSNGLHFMNQEHIIERYPLGFPGCNEIRYLIGENEINYKEITIVDFEKKTIIREGEVIIKDFSIEQQPHKINSNKYIIVFISEGFDKKQELIYKDKAFLIDFHSFNSKIRNNFLGYFDLSESGDAVEALKKLPILIEEIEELKIPFILFSISLIKTIEIFDIYYELLGKRIKELTNSKTLVLPYPICKL
jgi:hypothetical protein